MAGCASAIYPRLARLAAGGGKQFNTEAAEVAEKRHGEEPINTGLSLFSSVIPEKAGIQGNLQGAEREALDSRFRGMTTRRGEDLSLLGAFFSATSAASVLNHSLAIQRALYTPLQLRQAGRAVGTEVAFDPPALHLGAGARRAAGRAQCRARSHPGRAAESGAVSNRRRRRVRASLPRNSFITGPGQQAPVAKVSAVNA